MKLIKDILYKVAIEKVIGSTDVVINELVFDSRKAGLNDIYVAIRGAKADGHDYIEQAAYAGALMIVCEEMPENIINGITYVQVKDTKKALAIIAANYYDNPSRKLQLVGVTGTNGKTTVSTLLYQLYLYAGYKVGLISTIDIKINETSYPTELTTPDPIIINKYLADMVSEGVQYCFMEVSSHGIAQKRVAGLEFAGGVFTNLSHDHLDYHETFAAYRDTKKEFFDSLSDNAFALTNLDDKNGGFMLQNTKAIKHTYALKRDAEFKAKILENHFEGLQLRIDDNEVWSKLVGSFNAYNLLAIYATTILLDMDKIEALKNISVLKSVEGRFQYHVSEKNCVVIVDYAHTPDALENVLHTIADIRTGNETVFTVVGCGGDRDPTKRPLMAKIAAKNSNKVILTSDNPRTEDPALIIEQMEEGVPAEMYAKVTSNVDRKQAIKNALQMAKPKDIILIAGKGHEKYQEINGKKNPFDDMAIAKELITLLNK
ncbi:MAG TPA: UDP-N-acetylmuramoyl-L-alanyl-D-glutamate--2,6-diaminopimelate ligase [Flavobacteriaceae bacterium]|nr:UDP-N-acetylmuramoyl-L-alanyl-D-glutamate--2,6-diaminopimelate ligase [Flavobacteriaceae bacterium]